MSVLEADILIVGIPFLFSFGWFLFWVFRIRGAAKKKKTANLVGPISQDPPDAES